MKKHLPYALPIYFFPFFLVFSLAAETRVYRENRGKDREEQSYRIDKRDNGFCITLNRRNSREKIIDEVQTDAQCSTLYWKFRRDSTHTQISASRERNRITLEGIHQGKPIRKIFSIDLNPWKQLFSIDLEDFLNDGGKEKTFWAIGTSGAGEMKITAFHFRFEGEETIPDQGAPLAVIHARISLKGILSALWHGDYYFRKDDHVYVRYRGKTGIVSGTMTKELIRIE